MITADIVRSQFYITTLVPESPFIWVGYTRSWAMLDEWGTTWDDILTNNNINLKVLQVTSDYLDKMLKCDTLNDCRSQESSFYFDSTNSVIYIHAPHNVNPIDTVFDYGFAFGVCDNALGPTEIGGIIYYPYIISAPDLEVSEDDYVNQSQPTGVTGSLELNNVGNTDIETLLPVGGFDWIITESIIGNDVYIYDYEDGVLTPLMVLYVENYDGVSLTTATLDLQTKRYAKTNISLGKFSKTDYPYLDDSDIDAIVPALYGKVGAIELTCINPNQDSSSSTIRAIYRLPDLCTNIGTAYVETNDTYIAADVAWVDYNAKLLALNNGRESSGSSRSVKLTDCTGYQVNAHSYPADILQHFFTNYGGLEYTDTNFDKTEFEAELANVDADIGFLLDEEVDFWTQVYNISGKSLLPFRVDYNPAGKITARIRDYSRASSKIIPSALIKNTNSLSITTSRDSVYSSAVCKFYKNNVDDTWLSVENTTYYNEVRKQVRKESEYDLESYLVNEADAIARAYTDATRLADVPIIATLQIFKSSDIRLYDVVTVSIQPDNLVSSSRVFIGNKDCLVLGTNPQVSEMYNEVTVLVIPDRVPEESQGAVRSSAYETAEREKSTIDIIVDEVSASQKVSGYLTLPSISLSAGSDGVVIDYSLATGTFNVLIGTTEVTGDGPVYSVVTTSENMVVTINSATGVYSCTSIANEVNSALLQAVYSGVTLQCAFAVTKSIKGEPGNDGAGSLVTISNPAETTGTYTTGQKGVYNGHFYVWTSTGVSTGYWELIPVETATSIGIDVYLSLDEQADDASGATIVFDNSGNGRNSFYRECTITELKSGNALELSNAGAYIDIH